MSSKIKSIKARKILDSRGKSTIEVKLQTTEGIFFASVPSGTSKGKYEARVVKTEKAIENIEKIVAPRLIGQNPINQETIDRLLIKLNIGANTTLAVSIAVCRAGAGARNLPLWKWIAGIAKTKPSLPMSSVLLVEGGLHGKEGPDIQEFMVALPFAQAQLVYQNLKKIIEKKYKVRTGQEGGFVPPLQKTEAVLDLILSAAKKNRVKIILDIAASHLKFRPFPEYYFNLAKRYPILGIEDPFTQDDWKKWQALNSKIKTQKLKVLIIGDDLTVTNLKRIKMAYQQKACNAVILKPNQIGTVTETIEAAKLAKAYGWKTIVSHRAGETIDDFIADFAVGIGADFIKAGAPTQKERMVKYNRLLRIEKEFYA